jgi:hypothetical protein
MLTDILFVLTIFATRIVLPIIATGLLGSLLERALRHGIPSAS